MVSRLVGGVLSQGRRTDPVGDHPSVQPTWPIGRAARGTLGLAPSGGCRAAGVATDAGALLPHRFTLTCAVIEITAIGGLLSVALVRQVAPSWLSPALCSAEPRPSSTRTRQAEA